MARQQNPHLSHKFDMVGYVSRDMANEAKEYLEGRGFNVTITSIPSSHRLPKNVLPEDRELYVTKGKGKAALAAMRRIYGA